MRIIRFENLDYDFNRIMVDIFSVPPLLNLSNKSERPTDFKHLYEREGIDLVNQKFKEDFLTFDYKKL